MNVAVLLSGSTRFCSEFDTFTNGLRNFDRVDYYCLFWKNSLPPDKVGYPNLKLVADSWRQPAQKWAEEKIKSNLPDNHHLVKLEFFDDQNIRSPLVATRLVFHPFNFKNINKMHVGWKKAYDLIDREYDIIIRGRPDIGLSEPLDFEIVKNKLEERPNLVLTSNGTYYGYQAECNDIIGISSHRNIGIYCDLANHSARYSNHLGVVYHAENLLGYHLQNNKILWDKFASTTMRSNLIINNDGSKSPDFGKWK